RLRYHRRKLRVAEPRKRVRDAEQDEGEEQRGTSAVTNHFAVGPDLTGRRRANRAEDSRADDRADREHDQVARAHDTLQRVISFDEQVRDGLASKQLIHVCRILPCSERGTLTLLPIGERLAEG